MNIIEHLFNVDSPQAAAPDAAKSSGCLRVFVAGAVTHVGSLAWFQWQKWMIFKIGGQRRCLFLPWLRMHLVVEWSQMISSVVFGSALGKTALSASGTPRALGYPPFMYRSGVRAVRPLLDDFRPLRGNPACKRKWTWRIITTRGKVCTLWVGSCRSLQALYAAQVCQYRSLRR